MGERAQAGPDRLLLRVAGRAAHLAVEVLGLELSRPLVARLVDEGVLAPPARRAIRPTSPYDGPPGDLARLVLNETARRARQGRVAILIDGLEKLPDPDRSRDVFDALAALVEDTPPVDLVTTVPWHAAFGGGGDTLLHPEEHFVSMRPVPLGRPPEVRARLPRWMPHGERLFELDEAAAVAGMTFFEEMVARRIGPAAESAPAGFASIVREAAWWSGGIPRTFLQLLKDAATYAEIRGAGPWPEPEDLADAIEDQLDSFRRLLEGELLRRLPAYVGHDVVNVPLDLRVRLFAQGVLLEWLVGGRPLVRLHPVADLLVQRGALRA